MSLNLKQLRVKEETGEEKTCDMNTPHGNGKPKYC